MQSDRINSRSWRRNLRREHTSFEAGVRRKIEWILNNVELQRRELQKDHHGSKWGTRLLPEDEGQGQGLGKRVEKAQKSCRKCQGDSAWTGSEMTELLQEPSWGLGARICSGLTSVVSQVSPELHGQPEVGAKKETVESWCPLRTGSRNDRRW